jgi:hypothetical protein
LSDGVAHRRFGKQIVEPIYRDLSRTISVFSEALVLNPPAFTLPWRLREDFGAYPSDAHWGRLEVRTTQESGASTLRYQERWAGDLYPMLAWDRTAGDYFVYTSLEPDASDEVAVIDANLQARIEQLVWSMPGLAGTTPETGPNRRRVHARRPS